MQPASETIPVPEHGGIEARFEAVDLLYEGERLFHKHQDVSTIVVKFKVSSVPIEMMKPGVSGQNEKQPLEREGGDERTA